MADGSANIAAAQDDSEGRTARQLAMLQELAEIGMQMARAVRDEALARLEPVDEASPKPPSRFGNGDRGLVYSRIARAVRQTVALETRTADDGQKAGVQRDQRRATAIRWAAHERRSEIREYVSEAIDAAAEKHGFSDHEVERLLDDLDERIEAGDVLGDVPIGQLVARICDDLGLVPDWSLWDHHAWAIDYLKAQICEDIDAGGREEKPLAGSEPPPGPD